MTDKHEPSQAFQPSIPPLEPEPDCDCDQPSGWHAPDCVLVTGEPRWKGVYPGMCIDPEICRGYGHCPRDYSCCE